MSRSAKIRSLGSRVAGSALFGIGCELAVRGGGAALGGRRHWRWRVAGGGLVLALGSFESLYALDHVAVNGGAEGVFDGRADEGDSAGRDRGFGFDEFLHEADGSGHVLTAASARRERELPRGFGAVRFGNCRPRGASGEGALSDIGLAGRGGDGGGGEHARAAVPHAPEMRNSRGGVSAGPARTEVCVRVGPQSSRLRNSSNQFCTTWMVYRGSSVLSTSTKRWPLAETSYVCGGVG